MHTADRLVPAVGAGYVGGLAGAGHRGQGTIEHADDLAQIDVCRIPGKEVAPALPLSALQDALVLQPKENELEKLRGDLLLAGEIEMRTGSSRLPSASARRALMAYLAFLESMRQWAMEGRI